MADLSTFVQLSGHFTTRARREKFEIMRQQMKNERSSFDAHWRELSDFILPRRSRFFTSDRNRGDRRTRRIIDSTATIASRTLSSGMMGGVTSPARPWFRLSTPDPALGEVEAVKTWLHTVARRMITVFLKSNLYQTLPIVYKDMGTFGTGAMFIQEDFEDVFRTFPLPIGSYMIANDEKLRVRVFIREFTMTVRQIVERFGQFDPASGKIDWTNISEHIRNLWNNQHRETWIEIVHVIAPNDRYDANKLESKFRKYESVYYESGAVDGQASQLHTTIEIDKFLQESGFDFFPVLVPRWEITGEDVYGTDCPGMTALGDIKQLQLGEKRGMQAIEKMVNPPMTGPSSLRQVRTSILAGDITYTDDFEGRKGFRPVHEVEPRIRELEGKQEQVRMRIKRVYFEDLFLQLSQTDRREITAREIDERHEEKLLMLGSVLERLNQDMLDPLIDIGFEMMLRQGLIPPPPDELRGVTLKVEYISIMAQAQKLTGLVSLERFTAFVTGLATATEPSVIDKLDRDQMVDEYGEVSGVPPNVVRSDEAVARMREERAKAESAAREMELVEKGARAARDLSQAKLGEDNTLDRLTEAATGEAAE